MVCHDNPYAKDIVIIQSLAHGMFSATPFKGAIMANQQSNTHNISELDIFHCALIDQQGNEIPITAQMIQQACTKIESDYNNYYSSNLKPNAFRASTTGEVNNLQFKIR